MQEDKCHNAITKGSLMYLTQFQQLMSIEELEASALAMYAAEFWSSHLPKAGDESEGNLLASNLMSGNKPAYFNWIRLHDPDQPGKELDLDRSPEGIATPLYYAALLGLSMTTRWLLDKHADVDAQGGEYDNALQAASLGGHKQVVKLLLGAVAH
jgi:hypothetical protein